MAGEGGGFGAGLGGAGGGWGQLIGAMVDDLLIQQDTPGSGAPGLHAGFSGFGNAVSPTGIPHPQSGGLPQQGVRQPGLPREGGQDFPPQIAAISALAQIASAQPVAMPTQAASASMAPQLTFPQSTGPDDFLRGASGAQPGGDTAGLAPLPQAPGNLEDQTRALIEGQNIPIATDPSAPAGAAPPMPQQDAAFGDAVPSDVSDQALSPQLIAATQNAVDLDAVRAQQAAARQPTGILGNGSLGSQVLLGAGYGLDFLGSLYHGKTPEILKQIQARRAAASGGGAGAGGGTASRAGGGGVDPAKVMENVLAVTQMATSSRAKIAMAPEDAKEQLTENEVSRFATLANEGRGVPLDNPAVVVFETMLRSGATPLGGMGLDEVMKSDHPGLAGLQTALIRGELDGIAREYVEAAPALSDIAVKRAEDNGLASKTGAMLKAAEDLNIKEKNVQLNMAQVREINQRVGRAEALSPEDMFALERSIGSQDANGISSDDREIKRLEKKDELEQQRAAKKLGILTGTEKRPYDSEVWVLPDGRRRTSFDDGKTYRENGRDLPIPDGSVPLQLAAKGDKSVRDLLGVQPIEVQKLRETEIAVRKFWSLADHAEQFIDFETMGLPGAAADFVSQAVSQAKGLARITGTKAWIHDESGNKVETTPEKLMEKALEDADTSGILDGLLATAKDRGRMKSALVGLAYAAAAAAGQEGRGASDRDILNFFKRIGENRNPDVFKAVLGDVKNDLVNGLEITHSVLTNATRDPITRISPIPPLDLSDLGREKGRATLEAEEAARAADPFRNASREEILAIDADELSRLSPEEAYSLQQRWNIVGKQQPQE